MFVGVFNDQIELLVPTLNDTIQFILKHLVSLSQDNRTATKSFCKIELNDVRFIPVIYRDPKVSKFRKLFVFRYQQLAIIRSHDESNLPRTYCNPHIASYEAPKYFSFKCQKPVLKIFMERRPTIVRS